MTSAEPVRARRGRILVVDDSALVRMYYREVLEASGYSVDQALNGLEAIERVLAASYDLVIVDVNMPRMDGFSFVRSLRRLDSPASSVPALIITTQAGVDDIRQGRLAAANFYLVKPVSEGDLRLHAGLLTGTPA